MKEAPPHPPRTFRTKVINVIFYLCAHPLNSSRGHFGTTTQNGFLCCFDLAFGASIFDWSERGRVRGGLLERSSPTPPKNLSHKGYKRNFLSVRSFFQSLSRLFGDPRPQIAFYVVLIWLLAVQILIGRCVMLSCRGGVSPPAVDLFRHTKKREAKRLPLNNTPTNPHV